MNKIILKSLFVCTAVFALFLLNWKSKSSPKDPGIVGAAFEYVMPKLARFLPEFSLRNRQIKVTRIDPYAKNIGTAAATKPAATSPTVATKKTDPKKATTAKKSQAKKPAVATAPNQQRDSGDSDRGDDVSQENSPNSVSDVGSPAGTQVAPTQKKDVHAIWKEKLMTRPTKPEMYEFVEAYRSEQVSKKVFYGVLKELLESNNYDYQQVALYGLALTPSTESFEYLVWATDHLQSQELTLSRKYLSSYGSEQYLSVLMRSLLSENPTVVSVAADLAVVSFQDAKRNLASLNTNPTDPSQFRSLRGGVSPASHQSISLKKYGPLLSLLRELATTSPNDQIAHSARTALSQISDSTNP